MNWELQLSRLVRTRHSGLPKIIRTLGDAVDMIDEHLPESLRISPVWQQVKDMLVTAAETRKGHDVETATASRRKGGALSADGAGSTHKLNGPNFAHSILTTAELVAALP
jgi:hypothetical protein